MTYASSDAAGGIRCHDDDDNPSRLEVIYCHRRRNAAYHHMAWMTHCVARVPAYAQRPRPDNSSRHGEI
jgi:hypothetical protein